MLPLDAKCSTAAEGSVVAAKVVVESAGGYADPAPVAAVPAPVAAPATTRVALTEAAAAAALPSRTASCQLAEPP